MVSLPEKRSFHQEEVETNPHKELADLAGGYFNSRTKFVAIFSHNFCIVP